MFEKNLRIIKEKNPKLADELQKINYEDIKDIVPYETENKHISLAYKETPLHGAEPIREAKSIWYRTVKNDLNKDDKQIVFGLGLGYLFKRACISSESRVYLIEPNLNILRFVIENVDLSVELSQKRVKIYGSVDSFKQDFEKEYIMGDKVEVLFLPAYTVLFSEDMLKCTTLIYEVCKDKNIDQNSIFVQSKPWVKNLISNVSSFENSLPVSALKNKFKDHPALILAAGPSLKKDIDLIKENKGKFVTFAVPTVLKTLKKEGVIPDFIAFADSFRLKEIVEGVEDLIAKSNLILESRVDSCMFDLKCQERYIYTSEANVIFKNFNKDFDKIEFQPSCGSVSIMNYVVASITGASPIVFSGLDLALLDGEIYSDKSKLTFTEDNKAVLERDDIETRTLNLVDVPSANGNTVKTTQSYAFFVKQFDEIISKYDYSKDIVNTSLNGALVERMEYKSLMDVVSADYPEFDSNNILNSLKVSTNTSWNDIVSHIKLSLDELIKDVKTRENQFEKSISDLDNFIAVALKESHKADYLYNLYEELKGGVNDTRTAIFNNILVNYYFTKEMFDYTKSYSTQLNADQIANLKLDKELFEKVLKFAKELK